LEFLPIYCFPGAAWLSAAMDESVVLDVHEHYEKQTPRNRFIILGVNGPQTLTIPVEGQKGQKIMTRDIRIANHDWRKMHLTTIRSAYGRSAYFEFYFDELESIFLKRQDFLAEFNNEVLDWLRSKKLQITREQSTEYISYSQKEFAVIPVLPSPPSYLQVFSDRFPFASGMSSIDLLMNLGPRTAEHILLWKNGK
jgi:hypothetical protein